MERIDNHREAISHYFRLFIIDLIAEQRGDLIAINGPHLLAHCPSGANSVTDHGATMLRVSLGAMYLAHAHLKIFTFTLAGTADFFAKVGFPTWLAYPLTFAEFAAGVALIICWNARWVALALVPVSIGAAITHWPNGWVHVSASGGWEYPVFLIAASIALALIGNGAWALETRTRQFPAMPRTAH